MPIRIMHVVDGLGLGGLENGLVNLISRLNPSEFEHVVFAIRRLGPNASRLPADRTRVVCLGKKNTHSRFQVAALASAIREFQPNIVHSRNWPAIEAVLAARWVGSCAIVHSEHGLESNASTTEPWRRRCYRRLAFQLADRVLTVSCQLRDFHAQRTGFSARKIAVIHNGVDSDQFFSDSATRDRVRKELGLSADDLCIGCVGNLFPIKDHRTLLKAVAEMAHRSTKWRLLMIGEGPELARLQQFVDAHPIWREQVSFLGASQRVPELLNAMDVYVLPSLSEGISNSLLEAMATGVPVIATATGGNPEVIVDGESGLLFPCQDHAKLAHHLLQLQAEQHLRIQLGRQAVRRVRQEFSIESMINSYTDLYKSVTRTVMAPAAIGARA